MSDKDLDAISDELLSEFKHLGEDFPHVTKMFMDMVAIIAEHNEQIHAMSRALQDVVTKLAEYEAEADAEAAEIVSEFKKLRQLRRETGLSDFGNSQLSQFFGGNSKVPKKEDLN